MLIGRLNGLNIPQSNLRNLSLLMNLAWRYKHSPQYWIHILNTKYSKKVLAINIPIWRSLQLGWSHCLAGISYSLGTNSSLKFWTDSWCFDIPHNLKLARPLQKEYYIKISDVRVV